MNYLAQTKLAPPGGYKGFGKLGENVGTGIELLASVISSTIGILTVVGFLYFTFVFFQGALSWIASGGDKQRLEASRERITTGITGVIVLVAAIFTVNLIGFILGLDFLALTELFTKIQQ